MPFHDINRPSYARADLCQSHDPYDPILTALFRVELADYGAGYGVRCHSVMMPLSLFFQNNASKGAVVDLNAYIERQKFNCYGALGDPTMLDSLHVQTRFLEDVKTSFLDSLADLVRPIQYERYPLIFRIVTTGHHATTLEHVYG